jgi:hypothetical protein
VAVVVQALGLDLAAFENDGDPKKRPVNRRRHADIRAAPGGN